MWKYFYLVSIFVKFSHQPKLALFALWIWLLKIIQGPCWKRRQNGWIVIVVEAGGGEWLPSRHTVASSCASTHLLSSYLAEKSTVIACHITGWTQLTVSPKSVSYHSSPNPYTYFQPHQQIMQWFLFVCAENLILIHLTLIIQKIIKKTIGRGVFRTLPQNTPQCTAVHCNVLKCKCLNYSLQIGQIWPNIKYHNSHPWSLRKYQCNRKHLVHPKLGFKTHSCKET